MDEKYDDFNREERYICSHLFKLLHKDIEKKHDGPLGKLLSLLSEREIARFDSLNFEKVAIYSEVSLIRDYYSFFCKKNEDKKDKFINDLVKFLNKHKNKNAKIYSDLPDKLKKTHPEKIYLKSKKYPPYEWNDDDKEIYKKIQSIFKSRPDLLITIDNNMFVFEAKFTQPFNKTQLENTSLIAEIWAKLLYKELNFEYEPKICVVKLGIESERKKYKADIFWGDILKIAQDAYKNKKNDRSLIAFTKCKNIKIT